jgi:hypothetical protein
MPAYNFQERFVPMILDGTKNQTIRSRRRHQAKPGDPLYLFSGMRTKWCKRLLDTTCINVQSIYIGDNMLVLYDAFDDIQLQIAFEDPLHFTLPISSVNEFDDLLYGTHRTCNRFAWDDGFRPETATEENPAGSFELMIRFWKQTHDLPFVGDVIYW